MSLNGDFKEALKRNRDLKGALQGGSRLKRVLFEKTGGVEGRLQRALKGNLKETLKGLQRGERGF